MAVDWPRPTPRHFHWFDDDDDQCRDAATDAVASVVDDITIRRATAATGAACMADAIILHAPHDHGVGPGLEEVDRGAADVPSRNEGCRY